MLKKSVDLGWLPSPELLQQQTRLLTGREQLDVIAVLTPSPSELPSAIETRDPIMQSLLRETLDAVENGPGFYIWRGLNLEEFRQINLFENLARRLGHLMPQNRAGDSVIAITDVAPTAKETPPPRNLTTSALPFHTDRCDLVALYCSQPGARGGLTQYISAVTVFEVVQTERPELLHSLMEPLPYDRHGAERSGEPPWLMLPVFAIDKGRFISRWNKRFIDSALRYADCPPLTQRQREAVEFVDACTKRRELQLEFRAEKGDVQFVSNFTVWHGRSAYEEANLPRLMLRAWISPPMGRDLPEAFGAHFGTTVGGAPRGGFYGAQEIIQ